MHALLWPQFKLPNSGPPEKDVGFRRTRRIVWSQGTQTGDAKIHNRTRLYSSTFLKELHCDKCFPIIRRLLDAVVRPSVSNGSEVWVTSCTGKLGRLSQDLKSIAFCNCHSYVWFSRSGGAFLHQSFLLSWLRSRGHVFGVFGGPCLWAPCTGLPQCLRAACTMTY